MYHEWKLKLNISLFRRLREDIDEGDKLTLIHFSIPALLTFLTEDDKGMSTFIVFSPLLQLINSTFKADYVHLSASAAWKAFQWRK